MTMSHAMRAAALATLLTALLPATPTAHADEAAAVQMTESAMIGLVEQFLTLGEQLNEGGQPTVEKIVALLHPTAFRYEHPEYDADYDIAALRDGFKRRMERGWTRNSHHKITKSIAGANMLVIEKSITWEDRRTGEWQPRESHGDVTLFEFRDGRIARIREYWR